MKEGASAGRRSARSRNLPSANERRDRRKARHLRPGPARTHERIRLRRTLCSRKNHPPARSRGGASRTRWGVPLLAGWAKKRPFFHGLELHLCLYNKSICFFRSLFAEEKWKRGRGLDPLVWSRHRRDEPPPHRVLTIILKS